MMFNPLAKYLVTQTWAQHVRNRRLPGAVAGGVDYAMPTGTPLPILEGVLEWVTRWTWRKPAWYNVGLGNAAAYRRPDGTRTVYGHNSKRRRRQVFSGSSGTSNGPHVHVHDVLADGRTRVPPFSTIPPDPIVTDESENSMILLYNAPSTSHKVARRAALQFGVRFQQITEADTVGVAIRQQRGLKPSAPQSAVTVDVNDAEWEFWKTTCPEVVLL